MRSLVQTLQDHDPGFLRIVAELWGIELTPEAAPMLLAHKMRELLPEMSLPMPAQQALEALLRAGGRLSWEQLSRQHGPLRAMGAGRRDRTKPWRDPVSALEMLWYRGLLGRAFGETPAGPLEFGFVPNDILALFPAPEPGPDAQLGAPAPSPRKQIAASSLAVDDATTVLAGLRRTPTADPDLQLRSFLLQPASEQLLRALVGEVAQQPRQLKSFLGASRGSALVWLQRAWMESIAWNDLAQLGSLQVSGLEWPNEPVRSRSAALDLLRQVPPGQWWSMEDFLTAVQQRHPNFLRGPGGFENWYLQRASDGRFLTGFGHWESVEGAYLRGLIGGPLHWLGALDLGADGQTFCIRSAAGTFFEAAEELQIEEPAGTTRMQSDGTIQVDRSADRSQRYQIARFTNWELADRKRYRYRLSAAALRQSERQGLTAAHALRILEQATGGKLPAGPSRALERWISSGQEVSLHRELVLHVEDPQVLERLAEHRSTRRYLRDRLGPDRAVVQQADWPQLVAAALSLGLLIAEPEP